MEVKKQISILQSLGYGKKTIARELDLLKNTVKSYLDISLDKNEERSSASRTDNLHPFFPYCRSELGRKGVTPHILRGEYRTRLSDGCSYCQFCEYLKQYLDRRIITT